MKQTGSISARNEGSYSVNLTLGDNKTSLLLAGVSDSNLRFIEQNIGIVIRPRSAELTLTGSPEQLELATRCLERLARLARDGAEAISQEDVAAALREGIKTQMNKTNDVVDRQSPGGQSRTTIALTKKTIVARTDGQAKAIEALMSHEVVIIAGPAGTGKTYLAAAAAINRLEKGDCKRIVLCRPAVEAGERLGFLPGDLQEKVDPYLRPLIDCLSDLTSPTSLQRLIDNGVIEIAPLAFMRGRSISDATIILDEAQNASIAQLKMVLTRLGQNSRMFIVGDPNQSDLEHEQSGLVDAVTRFAPINEVNITHLGLADVVRHHLIAKLLEAYETR